MNNENIHIGVDARTIYRKERRGTGKSLIDLYIRIAKIRQDWEFIMYYDRKISEDPFSGMQNIRQTYIPMRGHRWHIWQQVILPLMTMKDRLALLHCPAQLSPVWKPVPTIVTVHDIIPLRFTEGISNLERVRIQRNIRKTLKSATKVLTVSEFSRQDLCNYFKVTNKKVETIHWAPEDNCQPSSKAEILRIRQKYFIDGPYAFAYGAIDPRKNTKRLIRAFAMWIKGGGKGKLAIAGIRPENEKLFREEAENSGIIEQVVFCGFVPEADIPPLLTGAECLVFPSIYEGFGLPMVDAMACGTPIIAADNTCLPEIGGDAALYINPFSAESIAEGIGTVMGNIGLQKQMKNIGFKQVQKFTWDKTAQTIINVFENVLNRKK